MSSSINSPSTPSVRTSRQEIKGDMHTPLNIVYYNIQSYNNNKNKLRLGNTNPPQWPFFFPKNVTLISDLD